MINFAKYGLTVHKQHQGKGGGGGSDCSKSKFAESLINKSSNSSSHLSVSVCLLLDACM